MTAPTAIAIDGPVASGKTAVGREVARRLGYRFLDTGSMYRAVTLAALRQGVAIDDEAGLTRLAQRLNIELVAGPGGDRLLADGVDVTDNLREPAVDRGVSQVSAVPGVRTALVRQQRRVAAQGSIVMVGRDIGTVVLHDASAKVYLDAAAEVRARRRCREMEQTGQSPELEGVLEDLIRRDRIDSQRSDSPLKPADDALIIDTDALGIDQVVEAVMGHVEIG